AIEAIEAAVIVQDRRHGQPAPAAEWEASDRPQQIAAELMADVVGEDDAAHRAIAHAAAVAEIGNDAEELAPAGICGRAVRDTTIGNIKIEQVIAVLIRFAERLLLRDAEEAELGRLLVFGFDADEIFA